MPLSMMRWDATPDDPPRTATRRPPPTASVVGQGPSKGAGDGLALAGRSQGTASLTAQGSSLVAAGLSSGTATGALTSSVASVAGWGGYRATQGSGVLAASTAALAGTGALAAAPTGTGVLAASMAAPDGRRRPALARCRYAGCGEPRRQWPLVGAYLKLSRRNGSRVHSITSSARARSVGGTDRPIASASFMLMPRRNLVGI